VGCRCYDFWTFPFLLPPSLYLRSNFFKLLLISGALLTHLLLLLLCFFAHAIFVVPDASSLSLRLAQIHRSCFVAMAHRPHGEFVSMNSSKRELEGHHHTVTDRPAELRTEGALSWPLSVLAHAATPSSFIRVFVFLSTQLSNNPPRVDFSTLCG
jgi:hypothetical protein